MLPSRVQESHHPFVLVACLRNIAFFWDGSALLRYVALYSHQLL